MLSRIRQYFEDCLKAPESASVESQQARLHLACATLMVELAVADDNIDEAEKLTLKRILQQQFQLDDEAFTTLWELAQSEARDATSLYQFTALINESYDHPAKIQLLEHLWEVAFADGRIDRYEEHLIRKLSELLNLTHGDFIRAKRKVRADLDEDHLNRQST